MLDFPASPTLNQIFTAPNGTTWMWDGAKWVSTSAGTGFLPLTGGALTGPLTLAADPTVPLGASTKQYVDAQNSRYRNRVINGDMSVDQRHGGATVPLAGATYIIDRWNSGVTQSGKGSCGQSPTAPPGFSNSLWFSSASAYTLLAADYFALLQVVEARNAFDLGWGTANAQPVMLEFWAASSLTGTFGGSIQNNAGTRSYPFSFSLSTASQFTKIRINIPGDAAGTWVLTGNAATLNVSFSLGTGSTYSGPAGAWSSNNYVSANGAVSVVGTNNAWFAITGVALMVGAAAANAEPEFKKYSDNLLDCKRYYTALPNLSMTNYAAAGGLFGQAITFPSMRAAPTVSATGWTYSNASGGTVGNVQAGSMLVYASGTANGGAQWTANFTMDADF